jgi:hypothetical protein
VTALPDEQNVHSMRDFLRGVLEEVDEFDTRLHQARGHVRQRLHALELAEDPEFEEDVRRVLEDPGPALTAEEFRALYSV